MIHNLLYEVVCAVPAMLLPAVVDLSFGVWSGAQSEFKRCHTVIVGPR